MGNPIDNSQTDYYVRVGATGLNSGKNWNNAWNECDQIDWSKIGPGTTIWIAGGHYETPLAIKKSGTLGFPILIQRPRTSDGVPTSALGWDNSYDSQVVIEATDTPFLIIGSGTWADLPDTSHISVNGRVDMGIQFSTGQSRTTAFIGGKTTDLLFQYCDFLGPLGIQDGTSAGSNGAPGLPPGEAGGAIGVQIIGNQSKSFIIDTVTFRNCRLRGHDTEVLLNYVSNITIDNCKLYDNGSVVCQAFLSTAVVFSKNKVFNWQIDGINFIGDTANTNWKIYSSLFSDANTEGSNDQSALRCFNSVQGDIFLYGNTFVNCSGTKGDLISGSWSFGNRSRNNIFWNLAGGNPGFDDEVSNDYDFYDGTLVEVHGISQGNQPFVNIPLGDYHITTTTGPKYPRDKAAVLGAPYDADLDSQTRGSDGLWDIGAYEATGVVENAACAIHGQATVSATPRIITSATCTIHGQATVTATGVVQVPAACAIHGQAIVTWSATVLREATCAIHGLAHLSESGSILKTTVTCMINGQATVSANPLVPHLPLPEPPLITPSQFRKPINNFPGAYNPQGDLIPGLPESKA